MLLTHVNGYSNSAASYFTQLICIFESFFDDNKLFHYASQENFLSRLSVTKTKHKNSECIKMCQLTQENL